MNTATAGKVIPLWDGPAPQSCGIAPTDIPALTFFLPQNVAGPVPVIIVFPGGGYHYLSMEHEGTLVAQWFAQRGIAAAVLAYRLPANGYLHPVPLLDAKRAVRLVRSHATDWKIDPARVASWAFPPVDISPRRSIPVSIPVILRRRTPSTGSVVALISRCWLIRSSPS